MKALKLSLVALSLGLLAACGSGGGGDSGSSSPVSNHNDVSAKKSIDLVDAKYKDQVRKLKHIKLDNGDVLDVADFPVGIVEKNNVENGKLRGVNGAYYTLGAWLPNSVETDKEHGYITSTNGYRVDSKYINLVTRADQMPQAGVATYNGHSVGAVTRGKLVMDVDFADKTVQGKIYDRQFDSGKKLGDITLEKGKFQQGADGIGFSGNAKYAGYKGEYAGTFAGPNAEELSGAVGSEAIPSEVYEVFGGARGDIKK